MHINIKENTNVTIEHHPHHKSLNEKLLEYMDGVTTQNMDELALTENANVYVKAKVLSLYNPTSSVKLLTQWITSILFNDYPWMMQRGYKLFFSNLWFANYKKGEYTTSHNHLPFAFSFVYFIRCPKGSSPMVFTTSGKRVKAEEGKVIIFPGNVFHHVPKTRCDGRVIMAGNINLWNGEER
tara:strand:- start:624 stop:1169 length:546 start_codon:yes stop_codon:yes gene_type:complete